MPRELRSGGGGGNGGHALFRAVDGPADVLFRWVCQLPYSYDWIERRRLPVWGTW